MVQMVINHDFIILSSGNKITAFAKSDSRKDHTMEMPAVTQQMDKTDDRRKDKCKEADYGILCLKLCTCGNHLAACNDKKQLCVWAIDEITNFRLICSRYTGIHMFYISYASTEQLYNYPLVKFANDNQQELPRKALAMTFLRNCNGILVADKSGDVYQFDLQPENECKKGELLFGHLSIVLDLMLCLRDRFVISCDRDEKIRVSCYPNCYNINSYCLGHSEFVIKLGVLPAHPDILISGSGDGTLRFWRFESGAEIGIVKCAEHIPESPSDGKELSESDLLTKKPVKSNRNNENETKLAIQKFTCGKDGVIAISYHKLPIVGIFKAEVSTTKDEVSCNFLQNLTLPYVPSDIAFDSDNLLVMGSCNEHPLRIYSFQDGQFATLENKQTAIAAAINRINKTWPSFTDERHLPSLIPTLYKQWFDNVSQFLASKEEMKKRRSQKKSVSKAGTQVKCKKQRTD